MSAAPASAAATAAASSAATPNATAAASPHAITTENIDSFDYFHLFGLASPVAAGSSSSVAMADVDVAEVRRTYRRLSLRFHPDKDSSDAARHAFEVVRTALETIIDPVKLAAYVKSLTDATSAGGAGGIGGSGSAEDARQRQRAQQAQEEAQWAADLLVQRAQERLAREAAARQAAQEREEAAQRLLAELTSTLNTPFRQMEAELVRDWDVDADMVETKTVEVVALLQQLTPADDAAWATSPLSSRKRDREDVGAV
ncbi:DNAJ family-like protein [Novymonas esmeraldas]|uniref:DNAJ family-like protein n=1 Tax=Novymonas esmeraldas TaxID=1808958 RepID=A0AAW0ER00_9TRYP